MLSILMTGKILVSSFSIGSWLLCCFFIVWNLDFLVHWFLMMYVFCAVFQYWFTTHRGTSLFLCASFVLVNIFMFYTILLTHFHFYLLYLLWNSCNGNDATPALEALRHWHMGKHITKRHWRCCWSMEEAVTCMCEGKKTSASVKHHIEHL